MNLKRLLLGGWKAHSFSTQLLSVSNNGANSNNTPPCVVVFGRAGAGKSTVADAAVDILANERDICCLGLDLDICVPQWMRDNFSVGIYPTLKEREVFALECCDYVDTEFDKEVAKGTPHVGAIISFSFVNTDLRDIFRSRFPEAQWILIDTSEDEATRRINSRQDHFYKGEPGELATEADEESEILQQEQQPEDDDENSEWKFAPVEFDHMALDGTKEVVENAKYVAQVLRERIQSKKC